MAKFRLLNSAELQPVEGGVLPEHCQKSGNTLLKGFGWKFSYCLTVEMKCESGFFIRLSQFNGKFYKL